TSPPFFTRSPHLLLAHRCSRLSFITPHTTPACLLSVNVSATSAIYALSLHDALPICPSNSSVGPGLPESTIPMTLGLPGTTSSRSEEHTSELQSRENLVCRLLLEKKKQDPT